jgi:hypothetical protein
MKSNREYALKEIEHTLFNSKGLKIADYFLVDGMPTYWQSGGPLDDYPMMVVIEIDELAEACRRYLRANCIPEFDSIETAEAAHGPELRRKQIE